MKKDKTANDVKQKTECVNEATNAENLSENEIDKPEAEMEQEQNTNSEDGLLKDQLGIKTKQCNEYFDRLQRTMAEFDNYKKRTAKEKVDLYSDAVSEVIASFLPVLDNLERALQAANADNKGDSLKEGIDMVLRQFKDAMKNIGVEEIKGVGEKFDPNIHNAVMHVEDESYDENIIVEEFQKGYLYKDKVIRHSMVKVAN